ncbi:MAG: hypothetical protein LBI79_05435 [Nitrososphaerota archaeon]|nr:hypothetical protein [Nitrososphaerota archaeon]
MARVLGGRGADCNCKTTRYHCRSGFKGRQTYLAGDCLQQVKPQTSYDGGWAEEGIQLNINPKAND